jgi:hypothetical protein
MRDPTPAARMTTHGASGLAEGFDPARRRRFMFEV